MYYLREKEVELRVKHEDITIYQIKTYELCNEK